jgi:hypothetical protein
LHFVDLHVKNIKDDLMRVYPVVGF